MRQEWQTQFALSKKMIRSHRNDGVRVQVAKTSEARSFSLEGGAKRRMRARVTHACPHPPFGLPLPEGEGHLSWAVSS
jgi:hypothetical protein